GPRPAWPSWQGAADRGGCATGAARRSAWRVSTACSRAPLYAPTLYRTVSVVRIYPKSWDGEFYGRAVGPGAASAAAVSAEVGAAAAAACRALALARATCSASLASRSRLAST